MVNIKDLTKVYGKLQALNIQEMSIEKGCSFGLVGNNGAGKTTLFSLILDIIKATTGSVSSKQKDVRLSDHWKQYTGSYIDESFLIDFLTPEEYFEFVGGLHGLDKPKVLGKLEGFMDFFNDEILGTKKLIRELSKGNQKKAGIAAAMLGSPEILILDEPFPHLDPSSVIRLKRMLKEQNEKGVTLLISSHDLNHITEVCRRIVLLEKGRIISDIATGPETITELENYFLQNAE